MGGREPVTYLYAAGDDVCTSVIGVVEPAERAVGEDDAVGVVNGDGLQEPVKRWVAESSPGDEMMLPGMKARLRGEIITAPVGGFGHRSRDNSVSRSRFRRRGPRAGDRHERVVARGNSLVEEHAEERLVAAQDLSVLGVRRRVSLRVRKGVEPDPLPPEPAG